jgi:hypothetical protein
MRIHPVVRVIAVASALLAAACATVHDPGWRGRGATPFDTAQAECRGEVAAAAPDGRDALFTACMARYGWHRDE